MLQFGKLAHKIVHDDDDDGDDDDDDDDDKAILPFLMSSPDLSIICMPTGTVGL